MKHLILAILLLITFPVSAAGPFDGVWETEELGYISVHERGGIVVAIRMDFDTEFWEAFLGPRNGNNMQITTIFGGVETVLHIVATSATTFTATQVSCEVIHRGYTCLLANGFVFTGKKIW